MDEFPFNLRGPKKSFSGKGLEDGETWKSRKFTLEQGVLIAEIQHQGKGDFELSFVPTEGFSKGEAKAAAYGGSLATGAAAGAAAGSIIPVAGTITGALIGGVAGYLAGSKAGEAIGDAMAPSVWTPVDHEGKIDTLAIEQVKDDEEDFLTTGKYRLEVKSEKKWACRFIQPEIGQATDTIIDEDFDLNGELIDPGLFILGPFRSGSRPVLAHIRHNGRDEFLAAAYSADGTHKCLVFQQTGQFLVEDQQTEIRPGKEYFLYIWADGEWMIGFVEGY